MTPRPPDVGQRGPLPTEEPSDSAAKHACRRLLAAQVRTGQHGLVGDALMRRVRELRAERWL